MRPLSGLLWFTNFWISIYVIRYLHFIFFYRNILEKARSLRNWIELSDCKVAYQKAGSGQPLILLHGIGANSYCWEKLLPTLKDGFEIWALDLPGFGLSSKNIFSKYDLQNQARRIVEFIEAKKILKPAVVGNSMGGAIAMELAHQKPDLISKIILVNPAYDPKILKVTLPKWITPLRVFIAFLCFPFSNQWGARWFISLLYGAKEKISWEHTKHYFFPYQSNLCAHFTFAKAVECLVDQTFISRIKEISCPVLIVGGANDLLVPLKFSQNLSQHISDAQITIHSSGGHHLQEEDPQWLAQEIKAFV